VENSYYNRTYKGLFDDRAVQVPAVALERVPLQSLKSECVFGNTKNAKIGNGVLF
jgi:hypothetical protein